MCLIARSLDRDVLQEVVNNFLYVSVHRFAISLDGVYKYRELVMMTCMFGVILSDSLTCTSPI